MAGGTNWDFERKFDGFNSWTTGNEEDGNLKHWRRPEVTYEISQAVQDAYADIGQGDFGQTSGVLVFRLSPSRIATRQLSGSSKFVCEGDELEPLERPCGMQLRRQTWKWIGTDREYDPDTGLDLET